MRGARARITGALALGAILIAGGCAESKPESDATGATRATGPTRTTSEQTTRPDCGHGSSNSPSTFDEAGGTYAALIVGFDDSTATVTFDIVQWLTGQDAVDAYHRENPGDPAGPPNDYFVVNDNDQLRDARVAADADVWLIRLGEAATNDVKRGSVPDLPGYLGAGNADSLYWLSFTDATVTEICEQYTP